MPRFFEDAFSPERPVLTGENARHIGFSLRMRPHERLTVCANGTDYECEIERITKDTVSLMILSGAPAWSEPSIRVTLFQCLPKGDKFEQIVRKSVELGVAEIVPVLTGRCVVRPSEAEFEKKRERLQKIAASAAEQSGRGVIPQVERLHSLREAAERLRLLEVPLVLYESEGGVSFSQVRADAASYGVFVGSEGGFDAAEIEMLREYGAQTVWLGKRILRCETAPVTALSILMFLTGNFG